MRDILTAGLKKLAEEAGYAFFSGFEYRCGAVDRFPAVWLKPPKLVEVTAEEEGESVYEVEMALMAAGMGLNSREKERIWGRLERDAVEIFHRMADRDRVVRVLSPKCEPGEYAITGHGEVSVRLTFRAVLFFTRNQCAD